MTMLVATGKIDLSPGLLAGATGGLRLAAAPTFALMACISAASSPGITMCSAAQAFVAINDMALMYLLMGFFHLSPWLKLLCARSRHRNTLVTQTEGD